MIAPCMTQVCLGIWRFQKDCEAISAALLTTILTMQEAFVLATSALPMGDGLPS